MNVTTCERCGCVIEIDEASDRAALEEAKINFPELTAADQAILCRDCWDEFVIWFEKTEGQRLYTRDYASDKA